MSPNACWRHCVAASLALLLAACASAPGIPDTNYFRLPERTPLPVAGTPPLSSPVVVEPFLADGVHSDQALLYSLDPDGARLRAYHYQLWVDPPTRMLQRRLIGAMRDANIAPLVVARLPAQSEHWTVRGQIEAFERIRREDGWHVQLALQLRADYGDEPLPRLLRDYRVTLPAGGDSVRDAVRTYGTALDRIYAQFVGELTALEASPPVAGGASGER